MFLKNIQALKKNNQNLAKTLENYDFDKARETVDIAKSKSDDIIFVKNNSALESIENPVEEAFYNVQSNIKKDLEKFDFLIIYGLGVGYLLDYVFEKFPCRIIVLEPDLNVLRVGFELVDYSKYLDTGRVFISNSLDEVYDFVLNKYVVNDKVEILFLKNYIIPYSEEIKLFTEKIYDACLIKMSDVNTIKQKSALWVDASIEYAKNCGQTYPLSLLENKFQGKTALILGAGPSLKENADFIKQNKSRFTIFAVNRTLNFLNQKEIIPDFAIFTDTEYLDVSFDNDSEYLKNINFIADIKSDKYLYSINKRQNFTYFPKNFGFAAVLSRTMPEYIHTYNTAGTATFCALNSAVKLGFKNIILCGCDLAFKQDVAYCDDTKIDVKEKEVKVIAVTKKLVEIKSVTGKFVKTREDYAIFVKQFEDFFKNNPQLKVYNTTKFGANIENTVNLPFNKILDLIINPSDFKTTDDIIKEVLLETKFNPIEMKKNVKQVVNNELKAIFEIRSQIKNVFDGTSSDEIFMMKSLNILNKINETCILSELTNYEMLTLTKLLVKAGEVEKLETLKLFLEKTFRQVEVLATKLSNV